MTTRVFFVRHAESPFVSGKERTRGLSAKGEADAIRVKKILIKENIDIFISSPFERAIQTIKPAAIACSTEIIIEEDLRERTLIGDSFELTIEEFLEAKRKVYEDWNFQLPGGDTSKQAQERAIKVLLRILEQHKGRNIAIGTHGDIMTLMMNYFDPAYHYEFWQTTSMPDIYELEFTGLTLVSVIRRRD